MNIIKIDYNPMATCKKSGTIKSNHSKKGTDR